MTFRLQTKQKSPTILSLPVQVLLNILSWLDTRTVALLLGSSRQTQSLIPQDKLDRLWRQVYARDFHLCSANLHDLSTSWMQRYRERVQIDQNWESGKYSQRAIQLPAEARVRALSLHEQLAIV